MSISTHYQPIISLAHRRVVGYEALLRAKRSNGEFCPPLEAFEHARQQGRAEQFDRLCLANHLKHFAPIQRQDQWLFLNLSSDTINPQNQRAELITNRLARQGLQPQNIVLEILEDAAKDGEQLKEFVHYYRNAGFLIAIDDFGTGHSNFDRMWELKPNIVKLDRSMLVNARNNPGRQRWLARCVALLRETGALIIIEGVETQDDALLALDSDADLAQGYLFAKPSPLGHHDQAWLLNELQMLHHHSLYSLGERQRLHTQKKVSLKNMLLETSIAVSQGIDFQTATAEILQHTAVERVYLLNSEGVQIVESLISEHVIQDTSMRYAPLTRSDGALWARRAYFRNAMDQPDQVQLSSPYIGLPNANLNITLSKALCRPFSEEKNVLCVDINAHYLSE
ncbi:EAL domain-containing protein [Thiomicrospira pelophila]|uniref:EAL domain-containing protein n=1 Tax=Thiomicrospira pelophila TaxID=934 RepID=UPI0004A74A9D|nr:EAL domain-containing protein [Thiomicrospira pelophila]